MMIIEEFRASRMFNTSEGWYIHMRDSDRTAIGQLSTPRFDDGMSLYAGPFLTRKRLESWFDYFIQTQNTPRVAEEGIPDHVIIPDFDRCLRFLDRN